MIAASIALIAEAKRSLGVDFLPSYAKDCSAFQFVVAPSGALYCLLASGFAYNESQADSAGQWMVRRPRPSTTSTETSTTTVTTTTSTVTTVSNTTSIEVNTTSLAKTSGAPTTTSEEEQEFPAIGALAKADFS